MRVLRVLLLGLATLLTCAPSKVKGAKLPPVTIDSGGWFVRGGHRFVPVGAHWVPAKAAMRWPLEWNHVDVEADFAKMRDLGYTLVRFDLLWAWLEPKPGEYNANAFAQIDALIALANKYGVYLHPSLFIGGEVGEAYWDVPWRNGRNPHTDPEMLRLEANLASELGRRYADEPAILAWDLTDEPPFWITSGTTDEAAASWTHTIAAGLHAHDKSHPIVVGSAGQEVNHGPFRADNLVKDVDFLSVHPFTIYNPTLFPDPMLSERSTYGAAFEITLARGAGKPAMVHEMGASTAQYSPERIASYERTSLYSAIGAGSIGVNLWCFTDAAPEQRSKLPYLRTPQETEWGMTTWDRKDKPRGREFRSFAKVIAQLDLGGMQRAPADAAIVVPDEWAKPHGEIPRAAGREPIPYVSVEDTLSGTAKLESGNSWLMGSLLSSFILGRRASLTADLPRESGDWDKHPIVLLPSPLTSTATPFLTHVHADFYDRAKRFVERGGVLYASVAADAGIPDMEPLFGARLADTNTVSDVTIRLVKPLGDLTAGTSWTFRAPAGNARYWGSLLEIGRGEVVAVDQDDHPAIVTNVLGKGTTLLVAYPLESWLAQTPNAFRDKPQLVDHLYRWVRDQARTATFVSGDLAVELTSLRGPSTGYAFAVNHSDKPRHVTVKSNATKLSRLMPDGASRPIADASGTFELDIDPWDAAVLAFTMR